MILPTCQKVGEELGILEKEDTHTQERRERGGLLLSPVLFALLT